MADPPAMTSHGGAPRIVVTAMALLGVLALQASVAQAAGIVTHAWMALDAIDHVATPELHGLLAAHRDQVRAGAEFPDGGYWTRSLGTPGGDYGEEAHWQRFIDAYAAQIRGDPACVPLTDPAGPCAATIAHLMGAAAHGMGDEVWDWLFEPNGPGFGESYLPSDFAPFVGPGGLEVQLDVVAIARHARPIDATPPIPDPARIDAAFASVGRADVDPAAFGVGEDFLEGERTVEAYWAPLHIAPLARAMPWTSAHLTSAAGGVDFGARAIAGYYEAIWDGLVGEVAPTRVTATAPFDGQINVPAAGWTGSYAPGSNPGNSGGLTRIAAALSSALPFHAQAGQGSQPSELPVEAVRLRDLATGQLVAPAGGYPRIVPYNPEAGEHVVAFQPASDLAPCTWYEVDTTDALVDARGLPVVPATWRFQTSGCERPAVRGPIRGTIVCDAAGTFSFRNGLTIAPNAKRARGRIDVDLTNCAGGQIGWQRRGSSLPIEGGVAALDVALAGSSCGELTEPSGPARVRGRVRWLDADGQDVGASTVSADGYDVRGDVLAVRPRARAFPSHAVALRIAPDVAGCGASAPTTLPVAGGKITLWPE